MRPLAAESCDTPGVCSRTFSTGALAPWGSASIVSWLFVSDVVPMVVKRLLRAWSKLLPFCVSASAGETGGTVVGAVVRGGAVTRRAVTRGAGLLAARTLI